MAIGPPGEMLAGNGGGDSEAQMPTKANWISRDYTHLMEQSMVFHRVVIMLAVMCGNSDISLNLASHYTGLQILHGVWRANVNAELFRFTLFGLSSLCLTELVARAVMQALYPSSAQRTRSSRVSISAK